MEHRAEGDSHVAVEQVLPVTDVALHHFGFVGTHVLGEAGPRRQESVQKGHARANLSSPAIGVLLPSTIVALLNDDAWVTMPPCTFAVSDPGARE